MRRSFTERVLGGVCGGLAASLRVNPWLVRVAFIVLTVLSFGAVALLYLLLWWILPQESLVNTVQTAAVSGFFALVVIVVVVAAVVGRYMGVTSLPGGQDMFFPGMFLLFSLVFFMKQFGG